MTDTITPAERDVIDAAIALAAARKAEQSTYAAWVARSTKNRLTDMNDAFGKRAQAQRELDAAVDRLAAAVDASVASS